MKSPNSLNWPSIEDNCVYIITDASWDIFPSLMNKGATGSAEEAKTSTTRFGLEAVVRRGTGEVHLISATKPWLKV